MPKRLIDADALKDVIDGYTFEYEQDYCDVIDAIDRATIETPEVTGSTSDGYHTFDELYEHRHRLFIALISLQIELDWEYGNRINPWKSKKHSDGSEMEGWFIAGICNLDNKMITYHLPIRLWNEMKYAEELEFAPEWDGHTSQDVLERLKHF